MTKYGILKLCLELPFWLSEYKCIIVFMVQFYFLVISDLSKKPNIGPFIFSKFHYSEADHLIAWLKYVLLDRRNNLGENNFVVDFIKIYFWK